MERSFSSAYYFNDDSDEMEYARQVLFVAMQIRQQVTV